MSRNGRLYRSVWVYRSTSNVYLVFPTLARQIQDLSCVQKSRKELSYRMVESRTHPDSSSMVWEWSSRKKVMLYSNQNQKRMFYGGLWEESLSCVCNVRRAFRLLKKKLFFLTLKYSLFSFEGKIDFRTFVGIQQDESNDHTQDEVHLKCHFFFHSRQEMFV